MLNQLLQRRKIRYGQEGNSRIGRKKNVHPLLMPTTG